jgi:hypothetical protein
MRGTGSRGRKYLLSPPPSPSAPLSPVFDLPSWPKSGRPSQWVASPLATHLPFLVKISSLPPLSASACPSLDLFAFSYSPHNQIIRYMGLKWLLHCSTTPIVPKLACSTIWSYTMQQCFPCNSDFLLTNVRYVVRNILHHNIA